MIWATYDVVDTSNETQLLYTGIKYNGQKSYATTDKYYTIEHVMRMVIDGIEVSPVSSFLFNTFGKHTVGILLDNISNMDGTSFAETRITKIVIPETIEVISLSNSLYNPFNYNNHGGWCKCSHLNEIVCKPLIPPTYMYTYYENGCHDINGLPGNQIEGGVFYCPNTSKYISEWFDKNISAGIARSEN